MSSGDQIPPGTIMLWSGGAGQYSAVSTGAIAAPGWLFCDGSTVSRTTYPALFAAISTRYNTGGESSTVFRLPGVAGYMTKSNSLETNTEHVSASSSHSHNLSIPTLSIASVANASDHSANHSTATISTTDTDGSHDHTVAGSVSNNNLVLRSSGTAFAGIVGHVHGSSTYNLAASGGVNHTGITLDATNQSAAHSHNTGNLTIATSAATNSLNQTIAQPTMDLWHIIKT